MEPNLATAIASGSDKSPVAKELSQPTGETLPRESPSRDLLSILPLEVRQEVYSYLLDAKNLTISTVKLKEDPILKTAYETSLFRVSRALSEESRRYFYSVNAFVYFKTNCDFLREFQQAVPMFVSESGVEFNHWALGIKYEQYWPGDRRRPGVQPCGILAARNWRNLKRMIHSQLNKETDPFSETSVYAVYKNTNGLYTSNPKNMRILKEGLKRFRQTPWKGGAARFTCIFHTQTALADEIEVLQSLDLSKPGRAEWLAESRAAKSLGDQFLHTGNLLAARAEYVIACNCLARCKDWDMEGRSFLLPKFLLGVYIWLQMSLVDSGLGHHVVAIDRALNAGRYVRDARLPRAEERALQARVKKRLGTALAQAGRIGDGISVLQEALTLAPGDLSISEKLRELNELVSASDVEVGRSV